MVPEALNFVHNAVLLLAPLNKRARETVRSACSDYGIPTPDFMEEHTQGLSLSAAADGTKSPSPKTPALFDLLQKTTPDSQSQEQLLSMALNLAAELADLYIGTAAFIEIFEPLRLVLEKIAMSALSAALSEQVNALKGVLEKHIAETQKHRQPLRLHAEGDGEVPDRHQLVRRANRQIIIRQTQLFAAARIRVEKHFGTAAVGTLGGRAMLAIVSATRLLVWDIGHCDAPS